MDQVNIFLLTRGCPQELPYLFNYSVAKQAKKARGENESQLDGTYSTERLEEILTDIELNLAVIHKDEKLEFSGDEGDDNFADCY